MKTILSLSIIVAAILLTACSHAPTSESDGRKALEQKIQAEMNDLIRLNSFKKLNGSEGPGLYAMEYTAEVEFLNDCAWNSEEFQARSGHTTEAEHFLSDSWQDKQKGQREKVHSRIHFEKTEKGWVLR